MFNDSRLHAEGRPDDPVGIEAIERALSLLDALGTVETPLSLKQFEAHVPEYKMIVKQAAASITRQLGGEPGSAAILPGERTE
jgi:hypothetical protein